MNRQTMRCPSCAAEMLTSQRYYRACGMNLEMVSKAMAGHLSSDEAETPKANHEKKILHRMVKMMGLGGVVFFLGIVISVIGKRLLHDEIFDVIGGVVLMVGVFIMGYAVLSAMWAGISGPQKSSGSTDLVEGESGRKTSPEGLPEAPASITEQTTKMMDPGRPADMDHNGGKESRI